MRKLSCSLLLLSLLVSATPARAELPGERSRTEGPPCKTIKDCWLDPTGKPIKRPKKLRNRRIPRGDCEGNLLWLDYHLSCEQNHCVSIYFADRC
jgi:hypothetical protein